MGLGDKKNNNKLNNTNRNADLSEELMEFSATICLAKKTLVIVFNLILYVLLYKMSLIFFYFRCKIINGKGYFI